MSFDPEKVKRYEAVDCWSPEDKAWVSGEPEVVMSSDFDKLLEMWREQVSHSATCWQRAIEAETTLAMQYDHYSTKSSPTKRDYSGPGDPYGIEEVMTAQSAAVDERGMSKSPSRSVPTQAEADVIKRQSN